MALIPLISGDSEFELVIGYLLAAGLVLISMCVIAGIVFLYHTHGNPDLLPGRSSFIPLQNLPRHLNAVFHGMCAPRGTFLFLSLGIVSTAIILILVALAVPCLCLGLMREMGYIVAALFALVLLAAGFSKRKET